MGRGGGSESETFLTSKQEPHQKSLQPFLKFGMITELDISMATIV